jgi:methionyl-tRNA formyltransferase
MKIVFFGTPDYILPVIEGLHKKFVKNRKSPIVAVVTQKPKPVGRKQILAYSPVDAWAHTRKIPIYYSSYDLLEDNLEADMGVLAAYGEIIPKSVIGLFPNGILNIHPSLLPKYRGASPVQAALALGDEKTGVTIIKIDEKLDHGPILSQFSEEVLHSDTLGTLRERLFMRSSEVLVELIEPYLAGKVTPRAQNHDEATFTSQITREYGLIPTEFVEAALKGNTFKGELKIPFLKEAIIIPTPTNLYNFIRALDPWPGAWTRVLMGSNQKRLKILKAHLEEPKLILDEVQLEGKNPVAWKQFVEAFPTANLN